jgi:Zn-dependent protease
MNTDIQVILQTLLITMPIFLLSLSVHEAAHAAAAYRLGDPTAYHLGRVTINPLPHIDWFGTVFLPIISTMLGGFALVGWAKPVPVDWRNLRNIRRDDSLIALAGPASNIALSLVFLAIYVVCSLAGLFSNAATAGIGEPVEKMIVYSLRINISLAVFNMIPIPPLDGSHIVANVLPDELSERYRSLGVYGILIILLLLNFTPLSRVLSATVHGIYMLYLSLLGAIVG